MIIYKITNLINNKIYIGQTIQTLEKRWRRHTWISSIKRDAMAISNAIKKYGKENFKIEKIDEVSNIDELNEKEIFYIKEYNSLSPKGYNLSNGGGGFNPTQETIEKIRKSNLGKKASPETIQKLRESHLGHVVKEETKRKLSEINKLKTIDRKVRLASIAKNVKSSILEKEGILYVIKNMKMFAINNNHTESCLCELVRGKIKVYKKFRLIITFDTIDDNELLSLAEKYKEELGCVEIQNHIYNTIE